MSDTPVEDPPPTIEPIEIQEEMERSFLDYAIPRADELPPNLELPVWRVENGRIV